MEDVKVFRYDLLKFSFFRMAFYYLTTCMLCSNCAKFNVAFTCTTLCIQFDNTNDKSVKGNSVKIICRKTNITFN